jgi:hypothetical protein
LLLLKDNFSRAEANSPKSTTTAQADLHRRAELRKFPSYSLNVIASDTRQSQLPQHRPDVDRLDCGIHLAV